MTTIITAQLMRIAKSKDELWKIQTSIEDWYYTMLTIIHAPFQYQDRIEVISWLKLMIFKNCTKTGIYIRVINPFILPYFQEFLREEIEEEEV